jgi:hypothetical protein
LDGLQDTHSIYRQNTDFNKIIANASAFIEAGGSAVWQFIPFKHNQHQMKDAIRLSQRLGFKRIEIIKNVRYTSIARHHKTGLPIDISPWDKQHEYDRHKGDTFEDHKIINDHVRIENCMHLSYPSVFLGYDGGVSPCCYMHSVDLKDSKIEQDFDNKTWKSTCLKWCGSKA